MVNRFQSTGLAVLFAWLSTGRTFVTALEDRALTTANESPARCDGRTYVV